MKCLFDNLEALSWRVFAMRERANQRSGQECCSCGCCPISHFKEEVAGQIPHKSP